MIYSVLTIKALKVSLAGNFQYLKLLRCMFLDNMCLRGNKA